MGYKIHGRLAGGDTFTGTVTAETVEEARIKCEKNILIVCWEFVA